MCFLFKNNKCKNAFTYLVTFNENVMCKVVGRQAARLNRSVVRVFHDVLHSPRTVTHLLSNTLQSLRQLALLH